MADQESDLPQLLRRRSTFGQLSLQQQNQNTVDTNLKNQRWNIIVLAGVLFFYALATKKGKVECSSQSLLSWPLGIIAQLSFNILHFQYIRVTALQRGRQPS